MKNLKMRIPWLFMFWVVLLSCNPPNNEAQSAAGSTAGTLSHSPLKVGGVYFVHDDSLFYPVKILAMDDVAVHVRSYKDKFSGIPAEIRTASLHVLIGHAPLSAEGFLADKPRLVKVESVSDEELEGYRLYLNEMKTGSR